MLLRTIPLRNKRARLSLRPDIICKSIVDVDFKYLREAGITTCFIDLDGTVVSRGKFEVDRRIGEILSNSKMNIYIATNRPKSRSLKSLKEDLYAVSVIHPRGIFGKPFKRYYLNAFKQLNLKPHQVIMIGDRYVQDILGANRAGIYSLLVYKLGATKGRGDKYYSILEKALTKFIARKYQKH